MSVNSNDLVNNSRILRSSGKKARKVLPRNSKAFPKDFFDDKLFTQPDEDIYEISTRLSTEKSPVGKIGILRQNFDSAKNFLNDDILSPNRIGYNVPYSSAHRRNSSNNSVKPIKPFDKRMTPTVESRKVFQDLNTITFRHQDPTLMDLKKKRHERTLFRNENDCDDKENITPNIIVDNKPKYEPSQLDTPIFKCAISREDIAKAMKPRRIDMDFEMSKQNEEQNNVRFSVRRESFNVESPIVEDVHKPIFKIKKGVHLNFRWDK